MGKLFIAIGFFLTTSPVLAVDWSSTQGCIVQNVPTIRCLEPLFQNVVQAVLALTGVGLFVMLVIGGFNFLLSGGDPKKLEAARGTLTSAIIGIVIIVVAFLIIKTVQVFTNSSIDVTQFNLNF